MNLRSETALKLVKGCAVAIGATVAMMLILAVLVVSVDISDAALTALNQIAKVASIFLGALAAVGRGGNRGFITGAAVGLLYMILGYAFYWALEGYAAKPIIIAGEFFMGAALGAISGALSANMRPRKKTRSA